MLNPRNDSPQYPSRGGGASLFRWPSQALCPRQAPHPPSQHGWRLPKSFLDNRALSLTTFLSTTRRQILRSRAILLTTQRITCRFTALPYWKAARWPKESNGTAAFTP